MIDQDGKLIARPQPDPIQALREIAPEGFDWLCWTFSGYPYSQGDRGSGPAWTGVRRYTWAHMPNCLELALTAIHLPTGTVHLQQPDGTVIEVTRAEWETMP